MKQINMVLSLKYDICGKYETFDKHDKFNYSMYVCMYVFALS